MHKNHYEYLNSLTKEELVELIYKHKIAEKPAKLPEASNRTIAVRLSYNGQNYSGVQSDCRGLSITECLENALKITGLGSEVVFCGRTDAGVSAINMVVSLKVVSRLANPNREYQIIESDYDEYPYDIILNKELPNDIRITGWAPTPDSFSARYDCIQRHYNYFFHLKDKNLELMNKAAEEISKFENFYHLSTHSNPKAVYQRKLDEIFIFKPHSNYMKLNSEVNNENKKNLNDSNKMKDLELKISELAFDLKAKNSNDLSAGESYKEKQRELQKIRTKYLRMQYNNKEIGKRTFEDDLYCLDIKSKGFLHNMVRKIFWVIENSGKGNGIVLKNVELAPAAPLVFVGCTFKTKLNFISNKYSAQTFAEEAETDIIISEISKLRYQLFDL